MTKIEFTQEVVEEIEQLAKAYANQHHANSTYFVKRRVLDAFVEGYKLGLRHALLVAMEESA